MIGLDKTTDGSSIMALVALYPDSRVLLTLSHPVIPSVNNETFVHCQAHVSTMFLDMDLPEL